MKQKKEFFKGKSIDKINGLESIIEKLPDKIYFMGHRLEDDVCKDSLLGNTRFAVFEQFKGCFIGVISRDKFKPIINFLKDNFISGYILWLKEDFNSSDFDFGEMFVGSKRKGLLTSIYRASHSSILNYDFYVPADLIGEISGMVFTDSGENSILLLENEYKNN